MKKTMTIVVIGILLSSVFTVFLSVDICATSGNILYVGGSGPGNYTTIHNAINNAGEGYTIYVYSGTYNENVYINKSLVLLGIYSTSRPVINGQDAPKSTIEIMSNDVTVSGFEIHNTIGQTAGYYGIAVGKTQSQLGTFNYVNITDCHITDAHHGILLRGSHHNVSHCKLNNIEEYGIWMITGNSNVIDNNAIDTNHEGINLQLPSNNNEIYDNTIAGSSKIGIEIIQSSNNHIYHNHFINNYKSASDTGSNLWDDGYPSGGNYWDDYNGSDADGDGIGDTYYTKNGVSDRYPLGYFADQNYPPDTPDISGPETGTPGVTYSYTFETIDPNGDDIYYLVDWGDNSNSGWLGPYSSGTQASASHGWSQQGTYIIEVKAKDSHEAESQSATRTLAVSPSGQQNQKPTAENVTINPNPATYGDAVSFYGQGSDNDGFITAYEWSEGLTTLSTLQSFSKSDLSVGTHIINFKVRDNGTAWSDKVSTTLVIKPGSSSQNEPPTADASGPYFGYANAPISFNGSRSTDDGTIVYHKWDFGDGTTIIEKSPTHIYTEAKNYTVTLTVTDDGRKTDTDTTYANVSIQLDGNVEKKTPDFEIITVIISITLILLWRRRKL